jgi:hypothetical protein
MEQQVLKDANNCLNKNIYSYLETSGGKSCKLYLNVVHFFQHQHLLDICGHLRHLFSCIGVLYVLFYFYYSIWNLVSLSLTAPLPILLAGLGAYAESEVLLGKLLALPENVRLGCECLAVTNLQAYSNAVIITIVKF